MASIKLSITVRDIDGALASFNVIRVKRSTTGETGQYTLLTAGAPVAATLTAPNMGPYVLDTRSLDILLDSQPPATVTFSGTDPISANSAASQINTELGVNIASDVGGYLVLTSQLTGTASKIELLDSTALSSFGWDPGDRDAGEDTHVVLQAGVTLYDYTDNDGQAGYFYKVDYYNTVNALSSSESDAFQGEPGTLVGSENLSIAVIDLVDARGVAVPNQDITFYSTHDPLTVDGFQVALARAPITMTTDNSGHAEVALVRGLRVRVVIEGTSIIRDIVVPDETSFDLLTVMGSAKDIFDIEPIPFDYAPRRTL